MNLKDFLVSYSRIAGTSLQVENQRNELLTNTNKIEFTGIISDVTNSKIFVNTVLTETNVIDPYFRLFQPITLIVNKVDQNKLLEISIGNLIQATCSIRIIEIQGRNRHCLPFLITADLHRLSVVEVGKVCIINERSNDYFCYLNGENLNLLISSYASSYDETSTAPSYGKYSPYTFYLSKKGDFTIKIIQKTGYYLFPSTFERVINYIESGQIFSWEVPEHSQRVKLTFPKSRDGLKKLSQTVIFLVAVWK